MPDPQQKQQQQPEALPSAEEMGEALPEPVTAQTLHNYNTETKEKGEKSVQSANKKLTSMEIIKTPE